MHFREGEATHMMWYLIADQLSDPPRLLQDYLDIYPHESSFGTNKEEIFFTAKNHLGECTDCFEAYKKTVHREAYHTVHNQDKQSQLPTTFKRAFDEAVKGLDTLHLL